MHAPSALGLLLPAIALASLYPRQDDYTSASGSSSSHTSGGAEHVVLLAHNDNYTTHQAHAAEILSQLSLSPEHPDVRLVFNNSAFHGFAASMNHHCLGALADMADVTHVEKTVSISAMRAIPHAREHEHAKRDTEIRHSAPWGLQRISSASAITGDPMDMAYTYTFPTDPGVSSGQVNTASVTEAGPGENVDIYIVDTGINVDHAIFSHRARMGFSFQSDASDGDGHGTHVAGTAAGSVFGVASAANVIGVKVLGADGSGSSADTIAGMDYVMRNHDERKSDPGFRGSIMSMSWGLDGPSDAVTNALHAASKAGVHVSLAAGNMGKDACDFSPSDAGGKNSDAIVTVGSIGPTNEISSFSNTGSCVDIYAPGESILSSWKDGPTTVNYLSGTSMACPHVTGVMASLLAQDTSLTTDPVALKHKLVSMGLGGVSGNAGAETGHAVMLNNGFKGAPSRRSLLSQAKGLLRMAKRGLEEWAIVDEGSHVH